MPIASIIIPCYNAERFIRHTIASAQAQTIGDIEIICVDDGSTDDTRALIEGLGNLDKRIRLISQTNGGEGPARDAGLCAATGDWLYFLDSDDLMEPTLLEEAIDACNKYRADLVVFRTMLLDAQTGEQSLCDWSFKRDWTSEDCFCPRENPRHLFNSFQNWVHNKLFRGSFVREHDLHMQHIHRTADLLFTCRAMAEADRVALLNRPLHRYRVNNPQSAMMTGDSYPLDFYNAFVALREALEERGLWELYHNSFVNWAIEGVSVNLRLARSFEGYSLMANTMRSEGLERLDILGFPREKSDAPACYDHVSALVNASPEEALFGMMTFYRTESSDVHTCASHLRMRNHRLEHEVLELNDKVHLLCNDLDDRNREIDKILAREQAAVEQRDREIDMLRDDFYNVVNSSSFKLGRSLTSVPRRARDLAQAGFFSRTGQA